MTTIADPTTDNLDEGLATDLGFGRAVILGSLAGILLMVAALALTLRLIDSDLSAAAIAGIAGWTGVWAGLFLGGTITVGRWAGRQHE